MEEVEWGTSSSGGDVIAMERHLEAGMVRFQFNVHSGHGWWRSLWTGCPSELRDGADDFIGIVRTACSRHDGNYHTW